ncbi:MAG TPA: hypothetical protein VJT08_16700 [Terriglobales bacterium]|jgi:SnoaL-like domain|nr:hypothetical protein [Terriglobales bacterium]
MALGVPAAVAEYLAAEEAKDADALASCFTEDALSTMRGRITTVVVRFANGSKRRTRNTDTSFRRSNVQTLGVLVTVRARLTGDFPGSPVEVDHIFRLSSDKIASLEIRS